MSQDALDQAFDEKCRQTLLGREVQAPAPADALFSGQAAAGKSWRRAAMIAGLVIGAAAWGVTRTGSPTEVPAEPVEFTGPEVGSVPVSPAAASEIDMSAPAVTSEVAIEPSHLQPESTAPSTAGEVTEPTPFESPETSGDEASSGVLVDAEVTHSDPIGADAVVEKEREIQASPAVDVEVTGVVETNSEMQPASEEVEEVQEVNASEEVEERPQAPTLTLPLTLPSGGGH